MTSRETDQKSGTVLSSSRNIYGYGLKLDPTKTLASLTLPNNANVEVLAVDLVPGVVDVGSGATWSPNGVTVVPSLVGAGVVSLNGNTLTVGDLSNADFSFSGTIQSGSGVLIKAGTGTFTFTGNNESIGTTTVTAGAIQAAPEAPRSTRARQSSTSPPTRGDCPSI